MPRSPPAVKRREGSLSQEVARRQSPRNRSSQGGSAPVLSSAYLQRHTSKNDLVKRLHRVVEELEDDAVEANSPDYPGLAGLAALLVDDRYLQHRDKDVRLHTVLACLEIFAIYAPEPPFEEREILQIFEQTIRQVGNLSHCTSPEQPNYNNYVKILSHLAEVRSGCVLVEMVKTLEPREVLTQSQREGGMDFLSDDEVSREEAVDMLCSLFRTIIHSINTDHSADVFKYAVDAVSGCVDEFYNNTCPIQVLDELLTPIGAGPKVWVTNPAAVKAAAEIAAQKKKRGKKGAPAAAPIKMPQQQIEQDNRSYQVARTVLQKTPSKTAAPIADLLNGIINGNSNIIDQTSISADDTSSASSDKSSSASVWSIIYEIHKISSQVLTTVMGNLTKYTKDEDLDKRKCVTKLLGSLFYSGHSNMAKTYHNVFSKWVGRHRDPDVSVRKMMVKQLTVFMEYKYHERELCEEVTDALIWLMQEDPEHDVRLQSIHSVCDLGHGEQSVEISGSNGGYGPVVSARLLQAVGERVWTKNKKERKDALTGLAQIYFRHYVAGKLKDVQSGGDDCDIGIIMDVLHESCNFAATNTRSMGSTKGNGRGKRRRAPDEAEDHINSYDIEDKYKWIPKVIFEAARFPDSVDSDLRDRVFQIVDDVLLGPYKSVSDEDDNGVVFSRKRPLSTTSRAVGFTMILQSLWEADPNKVGAVKLMYSLLTQKAGLQRAIKDYVDARSRARSFERGSEEFFTADAEAMEKLEIVADRSSPIGSSSDRDAVLKSFHTARDKHIFRILSTIASPNHSASARERAFDDLPKRTKSLGAATGNWVKKLARRCAMGGFINRDSVTHCIQLAQECFNEGDLHCTKALLFSAKAAVHLFNPLGASKEALAMIVELLGECQSAHIKNKKQIEQAGLVTTLNTIIACSAKSVGKSPESGEEKATYQELQKLLSRQCTKDATPNQAKYAIYNLASLVNPGSKVDAAILRREKEVFEPLLKTLTSPLRMTINNKGGSGGPKRILSVLAALEALADNVPTVFCSTGGRGERAVKFALESILLGRTHSDDDDDSNAESSDDESSSDEEDESPSSKKAGRRKSSASTKSSRNTSKNGVSVAVERACAAIELLVTHIRSTEKLTRAGKIMKTNLKGINRPSNEHIKSVFSCLEQILRDQGLPPSSRDRRECKASADRAAMRKSAAVNLIRLCDPVLQLEEHYVTNACWHTLSNAFVDEEKLVREAVVNEYSLLIRGLNKYNHGGSFCPSLRIFSLIVLCPDADHGKNKHIASGNAAIVGKPAELAKSHATECVKSLRETSQQAQAQCVAKGRAVEEAFENDYKFRLMPECTLSYAIHLLSYRRETPISSSFEGGSDSKMDEEYDDDASEDVATVAQETARQKMLRKRLRWLLEPLINSLGGDANNVSFLLRVAEILGNAYQPIDVFKSTAIATDEDEEALGAEKSFDTVSSLGISLDETTTYRSLSNIKRAQEAQAKLKTISVATRELLLSFVKKDVNLTAYPGKILLPPGLFGKAGASISNARSNTGTATLKSPFSKGSPEVASPMPSSIKSKGAPTSSAQRHAHFSPEVETRTYNNEDEDDDVPFGPMDDDDDDVDVNDMKPEAPKEDSKKATRRSSYGSRKTKASPENASVSKEMPLSTSPQGFAAGALSPIAQSASPAASTPTLASSSRTEVTRKQLSSQESEPSAIATSQSSAESPSPAKKKQKTPIKLNRLSASSVESSVSKQPARKVKSRAAQKKKKIPSKPILDDELDFDSGSDELDYDEPPTKKRGPAKKKKKKTAAAAKKSPARKSSGLKKSSMENKTRRRRAKA